MDTEEDKCPIAEQLRGSFVIGTTHKSGHRGAEGNQEALKYFYFSPPTFLQLVLYRTKSSHNQAQYACTYVCGCV